MSLERPHIAYPVRRDPATGKLTVVEQDTIAHIQSCDRMIASTPIGSRRAKPSFGWPSRSRGSRPDAQGLLDALNRWERRPVDRSMQSVQDLLNPGHWNIEIDSQVNEGSSGG